MLVAAVATIGDASAQQVVYAAKGQKPEQQQQATFAKARRVPRGPRIHGKVSTGGRRQITTGRRDVRASAGCDQDQEQP
jgi:hypothetical protein